MAAKQHRLNILIEAMKTYQPQYDGVDYISETIRHIINLAQLDAPASTGWCFSGLSTDGKQPAPADWTDILASQPGYYLRLAMTMDLCFSKGRLAEESDFPENLRGLFSADFSSITALVASGRSVSGTTSAAQNQGTNYFAPNSAINITPGTVHSLSSDEESSSPNSFDGNGNNTSDSHFDGNHAALNPADIDMSGVFGNTLNIDHLASEVLAAYGLNAETGGGIGEDDWIERAWSDEEMKDAGTAAQGQDHGGADKETARVLLDALRDDSITCAV